MSQSPEVIAEEIVTRVLSKLGTTDPTITRLIAQEVASVLTTHELPSNHSTSSPERVVLTANGRNRPGIVVRLTSIIDEFGGDIRDINQTIVSDYFSMVIVVDIAAATSVGSRFGTLKQRLEGAGKDLGVHVVALHDDILSTMHSV
ncbi:MAG: ACT domain-containing protein [Myxococcota bacterium]|nr:ACT domain-containing protein [Myxococcota bacterium]